MQSEINIAITGDTMLARRVSVNKEKGFLSVVNILRNVDVAFTHLETLIHDYEGPEVYPAAEAGGTWMRSPSFATEELKWMGFNIMSHASNHCMDYSYGGLLSTLKALDEAGIVHAGTGRNLAEAREPAYLETGMGRVALVSMNSSFQRWARAGEARREIKGRPGLNPLRFYYTADSDTMEALKQLAVKLGWWATKMDGGVWLFNPAGLHNTLYKFVETDKPGIHCVAEEEDVQGNLRSISDARRQADIVLVHVHNHEWDPEKGLWAPPEFIVNFAKLCIDTGADVVIAEGTHAPLRGLEIYKNRVIFYDPGDLMQHNNTVTRLPSEFYSRNKPGLKVPAWEATPADAFDARVVFPKPLNPPGGYGVGVRGAIIGVCTFTEGRLSQLKLYPCTLVRETPSKSGMPLLAEGDSARAILEYLQKLSSEFGTEIEIKDGVGFVNTGVASSG